MRGWWWALACLWLCACSQPIKPNAAPKVQSDWTLIFQAGAQLNPNSNQQPQPLKVRVYELASPLAFYQADFARLLRQDAKTLGGEQVALHQLPPLMPSQTYSFHFKPQPGTAFIAVFAEFTQFRNAKYKKVLDLTAPQAGKRVWRLPVEGNRWGEG